MNLWDKGTSVDALMQEFTVGNDRAMDARLARWDVVGSIAHVSMLAEVGLLGKEEGEMLVMELSAILHDIDENGIVIDANAEDIHSHIEAELTARLGDVGKKIHVARSRNDQVLVDLKLFLRHELRTARRGVHELVGMLLEQADAHRNVLLPGYTHYQVAMPSSFGLWFGGHAEALLEDLRVLDMAIDAANANPLGSAAGYGSSFPIDRELTTRALNFDRMHITSTFAQASRGRTERLAAMALAQVASSMARIASDVVLFMSQNFGFVTLPDALTTGSSIMPHKKNPDVFEVLRARCNRLQSLPVEIGFMTSNLPSGYHRDMQFIKDRIIPAIDEFALCVRIMQHVVPQITPTLNIMDDPRYRYAYSVDHVHALVMQGHTFRDAYRMVAQQIADGTFEPSNVVLPPSTTPHIGSIEEPGLSLLRARWKLAL
jgi:argininosuccinate lyase